MLTTTFNQLGEIFRVASTDANDSTDSKLNTYIEKFKYLAGYCQHTNGWFTPEFVKMQYSSLANMLQHNSLEEFSNRYNLKNIGFKDVVVKLIPAGNIPLVCFHDIFCILASGCKLLIKPSSKDKVLTLAVLETLTSLMPALKERITIEDGKPMPFDAIIATGSNNSSRYFDYYFAKYPHIIRRNRNSVAVVTGQETANDYAMLANDIFSYYGLGCRSVSKIYVPNNYNYDTLFSQIIHKCEVGHNPKYSDNYVYNKAIYLMNGDKFLDNNFLIVKEDQSINSPIGVLFAERYSSIDELTDKLQTLSESLQCVVCRTPLQSINTVRPGMAQNPGIFDYADGIDTMQFLIKLQRQ